MFGNHKLIYISLKDLESSKGLSDYIVDFSYHANKFIITANKFVILHNKE